MSEEKNTAMPAATQALSPVRLSYQYRPQDHVILQNQSGDRLSSIPLRSKLEMLPDQGCIKPRLSLWMLICLKTPSSCLKDIPMSRQDEDSPLPKLRRPTTTSDSLERENQRPLLWPTAPIHVTIADSVLVIAIGPTYN
jgi:hypothetical protein